MTPSAAMPAIDIVRPERMTIPAAMMIVAVMIVAVVAPTVVIVVLREGRSGQQRHKSGNCQHRTESTKSHS
jgi:coenzyme F420-reducing hydrogenase delta subunit